MQPDVSVIIAAYNAEAGIARAIKSALAQTGVTVEVIVADDRSSDQTAAIVRTFAGDGVRLLRLSRNLGPGGARNAGLLAATGRWVAILDSDDVMRPERLARMMSLGTKRGAVIVTDNLEVVQEGSSSGEVMFPGNSLAAVPEIGLADFIASNIIFEATFNYGYMKPIFERAFIEREALRYDESLRIGEDYTFLASALAKGGRCVVDPEPGYVYYIRKASISRVLEPRHVASMLAADASFQRTHTLDPAARKAFMRRQRSLRQAASFLSVVQHLKDRAPVKALGAALRDPAAIRHLRMPLMARLHRLTSARAKTP